jgi:hypothetical protein
MELLKLDYIAKHVEVLEFKQIEFTLRDFALSIANSNTISSIANVQHPKFMLELGQLIGT